jgi:hypothetical protein
MHDRHPMQHLPQQMPPQRHIPLQKLNRLFLPRLRILQMPARRLAQMLRRRRLRLLKVPERKMSENDGPRLPVSEFQGLRVGFLFLGR